MSSLFKPAGAFLLTFAALGAVADAQTDPRGYVRGRVRTAFGMGPLRGATARLFVQRDGHEVVVGTDVTDARGRYRVSAGPRDEEPLLVVTARGFAAACVPLVATPNGEGLVVDDVILDTGQPVTVELVAPEHLTGPKLLRLTVPHPGSRTVDLDGAALAEATFDEDGRATLPHVGPGRALFVVTDGFASFRPRLLLWHMGNGPVQLPPVTVGEGPSLLVRARAPGCERLSYVARAGAGVWDPDGGGEYRFLWEREEVAVTTGRFDLDLAHAPDAVTELELEAGTWVGRIAAVPGPATHDVKLRTGAVVSGRVRSGSAVVPGALVRLGRRRARTDDDGEFRFEGVVPGSYRITAAKTGFRAGNALRAVVEEGTRLTNRFVDLSQGTVLRGFVRDRELKPVPGVLVGVSAAGPPAASHGRLVHAVSDEEGRFEIRGLPAGRVRLQATPGDGLISPPEVVSLSAYGINEADAAIDLGATARGRVTLRGGEAVSGAYITLYARDIGPGRLLPGVRLGRLDAPRIFRTLTGADGRYRFRGLVPGDYRLEIRAAGSEPVLSGVVHVSAGDNSSGFDHVLQPLGASELDLPGGVAYRLVSELPEVPERWMARSALDVPFLQSALIPGRYRLEPVHPWGGPPVLDRVVTSYGGDARPEGGLLVDLPGVIAEVPDPAVPHAVVEGNVTLNGDPLDQTGVELTAYPLASPAGTGPRRLAVRKGAVDFSALLPRGRWLLVGRVPAYGCGFCGPFEIGTGIETTGLVTLHLDVRPGASATGDVAVELAELERDDGIVVHAETPIDRLVAPWRLPHPRAAADAAGTFRLSGVPSGRVTLRVEGRACHRELPWTFEPFDRVDLRTVGVGSRARIDAGAGGSRWRPFRVWPGGRGPRRSWRTLDLSREIRLRPGPYELEETVEIAWVERPLIDRRSRLLLADGGLNALTDERSPYELRGTFRGLLRLGPDRLPDWPLELIPVADGGYDFARGSRSIHTNDLGRFHFRELEFGDYALRLGYTAADGHVYRQDIAVEMSRRRHRVVRDDLRIETGVVEVKVVEPTGRRPVAGAHVRVVEASRRGIVSQSVYQRDSHLVTEGVTDDEGRVVFESMPAGEHDLEVATDDYGLALVAGVTTHRGSSVSTLVELGPRSSLRVDLRDAYARPLAGADLFLFDESGHEVFEDRRLVTDHEGSATVHGLAPGFYRVVAQADDYPAQLVGESDVYAGGQGAVAARLELGGGLLITVRNERGRGLGGAELAITLEGGAWRLFPPGAGRAEEVPGIAADSGDLFLSPFPSGPCRVEANLEGYESGRVEGRVQSGQVTRLDVILTRKLR